MSLHAVLSPVSERLSSPAIPVLASREDALAKARALLPNIRARAARTEADRRVPDETIKELRDSGLFGVTKPKVFGGSELGFASLMEVSACIASACGSTGWVFGVLAGHSWLLNLFPIEAQNDVFSTVESLSATVFRLNGKTVAVEGGYQLSGGEGRFCSGIDHAEWVIVGNAVHGIDGPPEPRFFLIPRSQIDVVDDWFTAGMRGTGSRTIRIANAFIPAHRSVALKDMLSGTAPGARHHGAPIYRMPFQDVAPFSLVGAPIGMARGALQAFTDSLAERLATLSDEQVAEQSATFERIANASADIDAAFALVLEDAVRIDHALDPAELTALDRARIARDWAYAAQKCRYAASRIFEASGGSSLYDASDLQRVWRDVNSAAQHFAFTWDTAMTAYGRTALGLAPSKFGPRGR